MNRELVTGLAQLSAEKGLPKEVVGDIIARALKRAYGAEENIDVNVDITTGAFRVFLLKTVVDKVEDPKLQILLDAAKRIKPDVQLGDIVPLEESAAALGRIGAQTAKQVIQQSLREAEREQVFAEYADREGDIINGQISRFEAGSAIMELGKAEAILPRADQAPHERYFIGQRGLRVQAIVNELGGEKIDIIEWNEKPEQYVANALEPAHVVRVDIVTDDKTAYVVVPDRQLSLAIGKEGQNARLAAKLTGWRIDIRSESEVRAELEPEPEPEPVAAAVEAAPVPDDDTEVRHDLVAEVEAESAMADEEELDEEDRALLGAKKKKERR